MEDIILKHGDMTLDELQHWGIKGMKWGQRRYQKKDGTLTAAGKKRYNKEMEQLKNEQKVLKNQKRTQAKIDKLEALRKEVDEAKKSSSSKKSDKSKTDSADSKPKSAKEMTDDELRKAKARYELERDYKKAYDQANPQEVDKFEDLQPKNMVKNFVSKAVLPAAQEAGKDLIRDFLKANGKKVLGLEKDPPPGSYEVLKKMADKFKLEADIAKYKKNIAVDTKSEYTNTKEYNKMVADDKAAKKAKKDKEAKAESTKADAQKQVDEYNRKREEEYNKQNQNRYHKRGRDIVDSVLNNNTPKDYISKGRLLEDHSSKELTVGQSRVDEILDRDGSHITFFSHSDSDEFDNISHHGIKGQKWGVRRYQNKNGSLTNEGKKHRNEREKGDADREGVSLSTISGKKSRTISQEDKDDFSWDVEGTDEQHSGKKLSSKNSEDVKKISKELTDYWDKVEKEAKTKSEFNPERYERVKNYKETYLKDPDAYAKAVLEEVEYWREQRGEKYDE